MQLCPLLGPYLESHCQRFLRILKSGNMEEAHTLCGNLKEGEQWSIETQELLARLCILALWIHRSPTKTQMKWDLQDHKSPKQIHWICCWRTVKFYNSDVRWCFEAKCQVGSFSNCRQIFLDLRQRFGYGFPKSTMYFLNSMSWLSLCQKRSLRSVFLSQQKYR